MMRKNLIALAAGACLAVAMPLAHAEKTTGETIDDSSLAASVKTALAKADGVSAGSINVEVYKGRVQLGGFVASADEEKAALATAKQVEGTQKVLDALVVAKGKRSFGETIDDTTIQTKLKADLAEKMGAEKALAINTGVRESEVLLSGFVADKKYVTEAGAIAKGIKGVTKVHNHLAVKD
jgi:osmotically-inducible protein OsmY